MGSLNKYHVTALDLSALYIQSLLMLYLDWYFEDLNNLVFKSSLKSTMVRKEDARPQWGNQKAKRGATAVDPARSKIDKV